MKENKYSQTQEASVYLPQDEPAYTPTRQFLLIYGLIAISLIFTGLLITGIITNWHTFITASNVFIQVLLLMFVVIIPLAIISICLFFGLHAVFNLLEKREELKARQDERRRANETHSMQLYLAESRIPADERGNRSAIYERSTGQIVIVPSGNLTQPVPNTYSPHLSYSYDYQDTSQTKVTGEQEGQKGNAQLTQPTQEYLISQLPESGLIVSPGIKSTDGQIVKVSILDVPHFKILGSTGFGKSCLAAALMHQATELNSPDLLQLALLDLEHKTSRLFENLPHVATLQSGRRQIQMVATSAEEVAEHLSHLKRELDRRAALDDETLENEPILIMYVEEMLSLQYEIVDPKLLARMFADLTILSVRGRKYRMFLFAVMQTDYSTEEMKISQKMFRFRAAAAVDTTAARAAGFINTDLIKANFAQGQPGQFVIEYPSFSQIVLAPTYDVKRLLSQKSRLQHSFNTVSEPETTAHIQTSKPTRNSPERMLKNAETAPEAKRNEIEILRRQGWGKVAIIEKIWKVKAGGSRGYKTAEAEYERIVEALEQEEVEA